jgi:EPS-associated MarR family transcriptional regulator
MNSKESAHLQVLKLIEQAPVVSQRALAEELGASLGKTHYILKALLEKGLVKSENFRRSDNKMAYAYMLTPQGLAEKFRLTKAYLARKESEYELLQAEIAALRLETRALKPDHTRDPLCDD